MKSLLPFSLLLAITTAITAFTNGHTKAAKTTTSTADSVIMAQHIKDVKFILLGELTLENANITDRQIDSMMAEFKESITGSKIFKTSDSKLKIFMINEEFCGMYCNSATSSFIHLRSGKQLKGNIELHNIDSIYQLPDGKYLVMQSWTERSSSVCFDNAQAATVISVTGDSVIQHPAIFKPSDNPKDTLPVEFQTAIGADDSCYLHYIPAKHIIEYRHGNACEFYDNNGMHTGYFQYQRGTFIQAQDSVWTPPMDDK